MPRFKCTLEYDGTPYAGWQWQNGQPSVQAAFEQAIFDFAQERMRVQCAGRTDAGVHATGQVVHLDLDKDRTPYQLMEGVNYHLMQRCEPVRILACEETSADFNARFSAKSRAYCYHIINRRAPLTLDIDRAWHIGWPLDVEAMREGAHYLLGHHDFTSFRAAECQAESPVKTLDRLEINVIPPQGGIHATIPSHCSSNIDCGLRRNDSSLHCEIRFILEARSFLHHQVRIMIGTLERVGAGKWHPDDVKHALEQKDRTKAGPTAPACGLYLTRVDY